MYFSFLLSFVCFCNPIFFLPPFWPQVKSREATKKEEEEDLAEDLAEANYDEIKCYREIITLIQPKETVAKAIRRLGGN